LISDVAIEQALRDEGLMKDGEVDVFGHRVKKIARDKQPKTRKQGGNKRKYNVQNVHMMDQLGFLQEHGTTKAKK
jgi:hypothetical protein